MAITPATAFFDQMSKLVLNIGGAVQILPHVNTAGGKVRTFVNSLTLASQASGVVLGVARIPLPFIFLGIELVTDTSLGSSTIAFGNAANGNSAIYAAAATFTATDTPTPRGKASLYGTEVVSGYDCQTGALTTPQNASGYGGAYEDIIMTIGAATMPASGNLRVSIWYTID